MANKQINQLDSATSLSATDKLPMQTAGFLTKSVTGQQIKEFVNPKVTAVEFSAADILDWSVAYPYFEMTNVVGVFKVGDIVELSPSGEAATVIYVSGDFINLNVFDYLDSTHMTSSDGLASADIEYQEDNILPIELLPNLPANSYYVVDKVIMEYTFNTTAYEAVTELVRISLGGRPWGFLTPGIFEKIFNSIATIRETGGMIDLSPTNPFGSQQIYPLLESGQGKMNHGLYLDVYQGFTGGDGTLRVLIFHETRTFGA